MAYQTPVWLDDIIKVTKEASQTVEKVIHKTRKTSRCQKHSK